MYQTILDPLVTVVFVAVGVSAGIKRTVDPSHLRRDAVEDEAPN